MTLSGWRVRTSRVWFKETAGSSTRRVSGCLRRGRPKPRSAWNSPRPVPSRFLTGTTAAMADLKDAPPPRTQVFLGSYNGEKLLFHFPSMVNLPNGIHGYRTTFLVGRVLFNVMAHSGGEEWVFQKGGVREIQTPQIWPSAHNQVTWPPVNGVMDEATLWRYLET